MKQLRIFFMWMLAVSSLGQLTGCGKDDDDETKNNPQPATSPTLNLMSGPQFTSADKTINAAESFTTVISGKSDAVSGSTLRNFKISVSYDNGPITSVLDSAITGTEINYAFTGTTRNVSGTEKWIFIITDNNNLTASQSFILTIDPQTIKKPSLEFIGGSPYTSADITVTPGAQVTSKLTARSLDASTSLSRFAISVSMNGGPATTAFDTTGLTGGNYEKEFTFFTNSLQGSTETWTYTITDDKGYSSSQTYTISISGSPGTSTINTFTSVLFGSYNSSYPGFYATSTGTRYYSNTAANYQSAIDFVYYYGATNLATLAAPNDPNANSISSLKLHTWTTKNATTFKTTGLTASAFDAATSSTDITSAYNTGTDTSPVSRAFSLNTGDVIAFRTYTGKMGLIKVLSLTPGSAGTITIDVKVQK